MKADWNENLALTEKSEKQSMSEKTKSIKSGSKSHRSSSSRRVQSKSTNRSIHTRTTGQTLTYRQKKSDDKEFDKGFIGWRVASLLDYAQALPAFSLFYLLLLWTVGGLFSVSLIYILLLRVENYPLYFGKGTHIGGTPKVFFEPNPARFNRKSRGLIEFASQNESSYINLITRYKKILLQEYFTNARSCDERDEVLGTTPTSACRVEREDNSSLGYGECAFTLENLERNHMGFKNAEPCIMLRLTKILGWFPDEQSEDRQNLNSTVFHNCENSRECCQMRRIKFGCDSLNNATVEMLPKDGIGSCAFPFWNQPEYQQPFVMIKLRNLPYGRTELRCYVKHEKLMTLDDGSKNEVRVILDRKQN